MTNKHLVPYFVILALSVTLIATDLYLPAMPTMVEYFGVDNNLIQQSLSAFQIGLVISALTYGPLSDSYGRRRMLLIGYGLFLFCSIALVFTNDIDTLLILRLFQGCGGGVSAAISPAIIRDCFSERESSKVIAQMSMVILLTPAVAPIFGGYLTIYFGWHACFVFLAISVLMAFAVFYKLFPETHAPEARTKLEISSLLQSYKNVFSNRSFLFYVLLHSIPAAGLWCYITVMPFVFIKYMGVETQNFGYYVFGQVLVVSSTSFIVQRMVMKRDAKQVMALGVKLLFLGCLTMSLAVTFAPTIPYLSVLSALPFLMGIPFIFPTSMAKAMSLTPGSRGTAASCVATTRATFSSIGSITAGFMPDYSFIPTIIFMTIIASFGAMAFYIAKRLDPIPESAA